MKAPTVEELEEMIQVSMDEMRRDSGGEFDVKSAASFSAGFKCGVVAILLRDALERVPSDGKEN